MSRIVVSQWVSLDGVVEDPIGIEGLGRGAWSDSASSGEDGGKFKLDEILDAEAMLFGRRTYDSYAGAWPSRDGAFADKINAMPKYVVSSTLTDAEWSNTTILRGDVAASVGALKEEIDGDILIQGSAELTYALVEHDLVDEWRLMIYPVVVGAGKRCFGDPGQAIQLRLTESRTVGDGIPLLIYRRARD
jgi:dihydrofolate reductase